MCVEGGGVSQSRKKCPSDDACVVSGPSPAGIHQRIHFQMTLAVGGIAYPPIRLRGKEDGVACRRVCRLGL